VRPMAAGDTTPRLASNIAGRSRRGHPTAPLASRQTARGGGKPPGAVRRRLHRLFPDGRWTAIFLLPYLIGLVVFIAYPTVNSFLISLKNQPLFGGSSWIGFSNYSHLLSDSAFWTAFSNTAYYVVLVVPAELAAAMALAILVNRRFRGTAVFRSIYFAPFVVSLASIGLIWTWLYSPQYGLWNEMLRLIGVTGPQWLAQPSSALPALALATLWRNVGYYMVIFLAGLQHIPEQLYEAAKVDGAGSWRRFRHVTWPMLTPVTFVAGVLAVILAFQVFDLTYLMTQGGPAGSTVTLLYYTYIQAFQNGTLGLGSASAFVLLLIMLLFTVVYFWTERRWVQYEQS
jgi:multiple sugar transport system permease protein